MKNYVVPILLHWENENWIVEDYVTTIIYIDEPKNLNEIANHDGWVKTLKHEFDSIQKNNTWMLVDLPLENQPIIVKWVYKIKPILDGKWNKLKALLIDKGF
jgi:hypothetical protein